jgi:hypothetical protein
MDVDDLIARESVRDLVARYNAYGDSGRFAELAELFAADAVMEIVQMRGAPVRHEGREAIGQIFSRVSDRVTGRPGDTPSYIRHHTATHMIDLVDADHARGRCYFVVYMPHGLDHWGRYGDEYVRIDGRWVFAHRKVHVEGRTADSWFVSAPTDAEA